MGVFSGVYVLMRLLCIILFMLMLSSCIGDPLTIYQFTVSNGTGDDIVLDIPPQQNQIKRDTVTIRQGETRVISTTGEITTVGTNYYVDRGMTVVSGTTMTRDGHPATKNLTDPHIWKLTWERDTGRYYLAVDSTFF